MLSKNKSEEHIFNIGSGQVFSVNDVYKRISSLLGTEIKPIILNQKLNEIPEQRIDMKKFKLYSNQIFLKQALMMVYHIQYHGTKTSMNKSKTLSIVIPVKNEEENLPFLFDELINLEKSIFENGLICEFIFLDNNSTDNSYKLISDIKDLNSEIISVKYTKDIGYEKSIMNGLKISSGDVLIILDSDLQDPPSLIIDFINHWKDGSMIVAGLRENSDENFLIKNLRRIFYFLVEKFSFSKIPANIGAFILFDKKVKDLVIQNNSDNLYIRGDILTSGFDVRSIVYTRKKRKKGKSNFNLLKLIKFSTDKIFLTSNIPSLFPISISILVF